MKLLENPEVCSSMNALCPPDEPGAEIPIVASLCVKAGDLISLLLYWDVTPVSFMCINICKGEILASKLILHVIIS